MKRLITIILTCSLSCQAQISHTQAALYNIGTGGFISGIGAIINKKKEDKLGKTFVSGFWKGCLGGVVIYESKNICSLIEKERQLEYNWLAKITNGIGASIIENGALNKKAFEQLNINIGFNRLEFTYQKGIKFNYKVMPAALILTGYSAWGSKFEIEKTLRTGDFIFSNPNLQEFSYNPSGVTIGIAIILKSSDVNNYKIINHELIHAYQYMDFNGTNTYLNPLTSKSQFIQKMEKLFHIDFANVLILRSAYLLQGKSTYEEYKNNYFENEARLFSK